MSTYFLNIARTMGSLLYGLKITFRHFLEARKLRKPIGVSDDNYFSNKEGVVTLQYPFEEFPVPDNGRYQLHNEIDDCIVCDKCAKICPVNCIDIEPVRAVGEIGETSDGTSKRIYAAKFDIDMSKCCFCGLCTVVCPTECLTMTKEYDFSVFDLKEHNFEFSDMSPQLVEEKKKEFEEHQAQKEKEKAEKAAAAPKASGANPAMAKPAMGGFKPKVKPVAKKEEDGSGKTDEGSKKPVFKPKVKPVVKKEEDGDEKSEVGSKNPVFRPKIKPATKVDEGDGKTEVGSEKPEEGSKKPVFRPKIKSAAKKEEEGSKKSDEGSGETEDGSVKSEVGSKKPVFRPKIKPKKKDD